MKLALLLFVLTYICMIIFTRRRPLIAVTSAVLFIVLGILPISKAFSAIDWNVLMMLAGTMATVGLFIESKMPNRMADYLLKFCPNVKWVIVVMSLFAGIVSAFVDNVATVLMIAPVGLAIAKKLDISPVSMLISISVSSNLQGAATLVGDTTSILLGGHTGMDFADFFFMDGKFSIFWAVQLGAIATIPVILFLFRKETAAVQSEQITEVEDFFPTFLLIANIVLLIVVSFLPNKPDLINGCICMGLSIIGLIHSWMKGYRRDLAWKTLREIDYATLILLAGLFVIIEGITEAGVIDALSKWFVKTGGNSLFLMYTLIVWGSVFISAFIDNIPYVATMLPVISGISSIMGCDPYVLYFGLLSGATLGGNLTPIGASANIATIGILQKNGYDVKTSQFLRIGVPFTLVAVLCGYLYCWSVWA